MNPVLRRALPPFRPARLPAGSRWAALRRLRAALRGVRAALDRCAPRPFRAALLAGGTLVGLTALPSQGADGTLGSVVDPGPTVAAPWRLRQAVADTPAPTLYGAPRGGPAVPIPEARRRVRLVYPALTETR